MITETLANDWTRGGPSRRMTRLSKSQKDARRPNNLLTSRKVTRIGTWNVGSMNQTGRTAIIAAEMRYKMEVLGLSETRLDAIWEVQAYYSRTAFVFGPCTRTTMRCTHKELVS